MKSSTACSGTYLCRPLQREAGLEQIGRAYPLSRRLLIALAYVVITP